MKDVDRLAQELKKTKPFDGFSDFSFWFVSLTKKEEGLLFTLTPGFPPLRAKSDFLQDIFVKLGRDYKLIIVDRTGLVSCAELSSINMTSLIILGRKMYASEESFSKGFLHELGHSLGLRDECVACEELSSAGEPNCARDKEEAIKWWGDLVGKDPRVNYISGCCGNKGYIRPTAVSLMNDPDKADDFGPVNERYLKQVLSLPAKK
ncbi:MAG: hypothetical protein NT088_02485 [Candidatus Omnitrophica bacterium]|nr:hypothetical protein [Candidatus Omnitrophota bacterium]